MGITTAPALFIDGDKRGGKATFNLDDDYAIRYALGLTIVW